VKKRSLELKKGFKQPDKEIAKCPDIDSNTNVPEGYVVWGKLPGDSEETKQCR